MMKYLILVLSFLVLISCVDKEQIRKQRRYNYFSKKVDFTKENNEILYTIELKDRSIDEYRNFKFNEYEKLKELNFPKDTFYGEFLKLDTINSKIKVIEVSRRDSILLEINSEIEIGTVKIQDVDFALLKSINYSIKHDSLFSFDLHPFFDYFFNNDDYYIEIEGHKYKGSVNDTLNLALVTTYQINGDGIFKKSDARRSISSSEKVASNFLHLGLSSRNSYQRLKKYAKSERFNDVIIATLQNSTNVKTEIRVVSEWSDN